MKPIAVRRRRMIVGLALMVVIGSWMTWRITHRQDPRFVGRWLFNWGTAPTAAALEQVPESGSTEDRLVWTLNADGTGTLHTSFWFSGIEQHSHSTFTWRTDGEFLHVKWGDPLQGWAGAKQTFAEIFRSLQGRSQGRQPDRYAYTYEVGAGTTGDVHQWVLQFQTDAGLRTDDTYYLTRIPPE